MAYHPYVLKLLPTSNLAVLTKVVLEVESHGTVIWSFLLDTLIQFSPGFQFTDVSSLIHVIQYNIGYMDNNSILCNLLNNTLTDELITISTTVLQSWKHLLRHTGGNIYLHKCLSTLITWIPTYNGDLCMATIAETPEIIIIQDTPRQHECVQQVEPAYVEYILGV